MSCVTALSSNNYCKRGLNVLKLLTRLGAVLILLGSCFHNLDAQQRAKSIVLIDADIGRTIESIHEFSYDQPSFTFTLKHRMTHNLPMEINLLRSERFNKGPYSLEQELPAIINPGEAVNLTFNVDYARSIRDRSTITFLISPVGDADPTTRGITFHVEMSAKGMMMFWDNRANKYSTTLPNFSFGSPGDQLVEITWNGNGDGKASFAIDNNSRDAYKLISNTSAGTPIPIGSEIKLGKGGKSFFVRYAPPGGRRTSDVGTLIFTDLNSKSGSSGGVKTILVSLDAKGNRGTSAFLAGNNTGGVGTTNILSGNSTTVISGSNNSGNTGNPDNNDAGSVGAVAMGGVGNGSRTPKNNGNTGNTGNTSGNGNPNASVGNSGNSGFGTGRPVGGTNGSGNAGDRNNSGNNGNGSSGGLVPDGGGIEPGSGEALTLVEPDRAIVDPATAMERLEAIYENRSGYDHIIIPRVTFKKDPNGNEPDKFTASIPIALDTLLGDKNFKFTPHHVAAINSRDSVELQVLFFDEDSLKLRIGIHPDDEALVAYEDSFNIQVGLTPYYLAGDQPVYLEDQNKVLTGGSIGKMFSKSNWLMWLLIGIGAFIFLFFFFGRMWVRQAVKSFRYLREAKYQRMRRVRQESMDQYTTETIYIDLARHNTDLIQLNFLERDPDNPDGIIKKKVLEATVPTPNRTGLRRFFVWFYGIFGMDKEPRFNSVYYSFRIEPQKGGIPQHLRLKDDKGLLLLGTTMTQKVLATDHQDVRFTERPFNYSIYLDPTEILDYTGSMRSVSIMFRVMEEPFEGYLTTRDFKLDLELAPKY